MNTTDRAAMTKALEQIRLNLTTIETLLATIEVPEPDDMAAFYAVVRKVKLFGGTLTQAQVDGCNRILAATEGMPTAWRAYCLATAYHETDKAMQPIPEYGRGKGKPYGVADPPGSGLIYYGRGDVQLTWRRNYALAEQKLGVPLVAQPELALRPDISARVLAEGMREGWFTGKALRQYLPEIASREQFAAARRIVNGTDRADLIAGYALSFQSALLAAQRPESLA